MSQPNLNNEEPSKRNNEEPSKRNKEEPDAKRRKTKDGQLQNESYEITYHNGDTYKGG